MRHILEERQGEYDHVGDATVDRTTLLVARTFALCAAEGPGDGAGFGSTSEFTPVAFTQSAPRE